MDTYLDLEVIWNLCHIIIMVKNLIRDREEDREALKTTQTLLNNQAHNPNPIPSTALKEKITAPEEKIGNLFEKHWNRLPLI